MSGSRQTDAILLAWRNSGVPVQDAEHAASRRDGAVNRLEFLIADTAAKHRRFTRRRRTLSGAALAAVVLLAFTLLLGKEESHGAAVAVFESAPGGALIHREASVLTSAEAAHQVLGGDELIARAPIEARLLNGVVIGLRAATQLRFVDSDGYHLHLVVGVVSVSVPKLGDSASFSIDTPDATVVVHGTRFTVAVAPGESPLTRVTVLEGRVSVAHAGREVMLGPGERYPSTSGASLPKRVSEPAPSKAVEGGGVAGARIESPVDPATPTEPKHPKKLAPPSARETTLRARPVASGEPTRDPQPAEPERARQESSQLAEQTALFTSAMRAKQAGNDRRVVELLGRFLEQYGRSALAEDARVERFRALERLGQHEAASRDARRYLADHNDGFAHDEARDLALPATQSRKAPQE